MWIADKESSVVKHIYLISFNIVINYTHLRKFSRRAPSKQLANSHTHTEQRNRTQKEKKYYLSSVVGFSFNLRPQKCDHCEWCWRWMCCCRPKKGWDQVPIRTHLEAKPFSEKHKQKLIFRLVLAFCVRARSTQSSAASGHSTQQRPTTATQLTRSIAIMPMWRNDLFDAVRLCRIQKICKCFISCAAAM